MSDQDQHGPVQQLQLTERELAVAKAAARMAVQELTDDFYKSVGKTVVSRFFIMVGILVVGFSAGKGWINLSGLLGK